MPSSSARRFDPGSFMRAGWRLLQQPALRRRAARRLARRPWPQRLAAYTLAPLLWLFFHMALLVLILLFLAMPVFWLLDLL